MDGGGAALGPPPRHDPLGWWFDACRGSRQLTASQSLELRWFGRGEPPAELAGIAAAGRTERRTDRYALLGRDDVSVKLRGRSRLGIKQRRCRVPVADGLPLAERWSRRGGRTPGRPVAQDPWWVAVPKRRSRVLVDLGGADAVPATGRRRAIARGGAVELVVLELAGVGPLWSAACETWGPGDREGLARLLGWSGIDWPAVDRAAWFDGGYPAALNRLGVTPG